MEIGTFMLSNAWIIAYYVIANLSILSRNRHEDFYEVSACLPFIDKPEKGLKLKRMVITRTINPI